MAVDPRGSYDLKDRFNEASKGADNVRVNDFIGCSASGEFEGQGATQAWKIGEEQKNTWVVG